MRESSYLEYVIRRFTLEKGYRLLAAPNEEGRLQTDAVDPSRFDYTLPMISIPNLLPLMDHFDAILVKADGVSFDVLLVLGSEQELSEHDISRETLLSMGESCLPFTGQMGYSKLPVWFRILLLNPKIGDDSQLFYPNYHLRPGVKVKVGLAVYGLDFSSKKVRAKSALGLSLYLRQILKNQHQTEEEMLWELKHAGVRVMPMVLSVVGGVMAALGCRYLAGYLGAQNGSLYGGIDVIFGVLTIGASVMLRRIRAKSVLQASLTAALYCSALYGLLVFLGATLSFGMGVNAVVIVALAFTVGSVSEMA